MASWRRQPGRPRNDWLNKIQEEANALLLSTLWTDMRSPVVMDGRNRSLGLRGNDDDVDDKG